MQDWTLKNKEYIVEYNKNYYKNNCEELKNKQKIWTSKNKEHIQQRDKLYY